MKILVIRFSSMGDIIYTTPVVRCLKQQLPDAEIHFITKPAFKYIYEGNPYTDKLLLLKPKLADTIAEIKSESYDHIIDLHNNLRTAIIKLRTGIPAYTYQKQTIRKWLSLKLKKNLVSPLHLVDRYLNAVKPLGVVNDGKPIDYFIKKSYDTADLLPATHQAGYIAFIIGATHFTKRMPNDKIISICKQINLPVLLLGGNDVANNGEEIAAAIGPKAYNACGKTSLDESVFLVSTAMRIIGFDTGLTHIAEAFDRPIVSVWGGTVPDLLGVQPYMVKDSLVAGIDISCRPCSKFGLAKCPLGHFKCMRDMPEKPITDFLNKL
ncbi:MULTISPECIES: glycosyltransferase family 9 protein [unclassified Mucilaginibacter]|uniref:glycosyltransferase family 9 protein n=1 Tax=unclassified Mucilaginibacter TaxID=2617802 RepID=UPI000966FF71|nr:MULTISPECIES: glycosyltransferase family 9 protein [unclassified Mucilaginibacter]OJW14831.1 MAG: glycosyl transferase [Mucilaginibacter sp. 44-25]PLW89485.1 MAG: glycosyl transferase [Mucilaginibacter sp.]PMP65470.1 MAG: glycosyl transferase [Mucilaginibacter sp.]HEK20285.1 lipopolysaccharide heptosyltransferase family protein [Bacteroidota bacterium]